MSDAPLAHSAPSHRPWLGPQTYAAHVNGVCERASANADQMLAHVMGPPAKFREAVLQAARYHDLGKLDPGNQAVLASLDQQRLPVDHIEAGVAHLMSRGCEFAAWLVRAHHSPGLPRLAQEQCRPQPLRGCRNRDADAREHSALTSITDRQLGDYLALHFREAGDHGVTAISPAHGLAMRLALSCLVDADHTDSAFAESGYEATGAPPARWEERLQMLVTYVSSLPGKGDPRRVSQRQAFFQACLASPITESLVACEGSVGIGKTTAVTAFLLCRAIAKKSRRLIIVAPFTNILQQTAQRLREGLVLPGENPSEVVVEHHHRADYGSSATRELAALWRAPVVVTTAVQFFETLAANRPTNLRKLHELPGSAVFIDECHAAVPVRLWPQAWLWLQELAARWGCSFVLASGSLARFWESPKLVSPPATLPVLAGELTRGQVTSEAGRVRLQRMTGTATRESLCDAISGRLAADEGPVLAILNTVQSAAVVARDLRQRGVDTLHLSTALAPADRATILQLVRSRLDAGRNDAHWVLVATSCVEAGVDLSFGVAFREIASLMSLLQTSGRVNRHGETTWRLPEVVAFDIADELIVPHPDFDVSAVVLREMFERDMVNAADRSSADLVTIAMEQELRRRGKQGRELLLAETERDYPQVAKLGRVITADTRSVLVDLELADKLRKGQRLEWRVIMDRSVQLWAQKVERLALQPLFPFSSADDLFVWDDEYDGAFLGYMAGVLKHQQFLISGGAVI